MTPGSRPKKGSSFEPIGSRRGSAVDRGKHSPVGPACDGGCQWRQRELVKPPGSLGRLEEIAIRVAGMTGEDRPRAECKLVLIFAADHGVTVEGVSAYPSAVTAQMVHAFAAGTAAVSVLARHAGAEVVVVDVGVASPLAAESPYRTSQGALGNQLVHGWTGDATGRGRDGDARRNGGRRCPTSNWDRPPCPWRDGHRQHHRRGRGDRRAARSRPGARGRPRHRTR